MKIIKIKLYGDVMYMTFVNNYKGNTNTCRITENNEFFFSSDYLEKNLDTLHFYTTPVILENQVTKVIVSDMELLPLVKKFIKLYPTITNLQIEDDCELTISVAKIIMNLTNIKVIDCYDIEEKLYYELLSKHNKKILLRSEVLFQSYIMKLNNIDTFNKLYQVKKIYIDNELDEFDKDELMYLLNHNIVLEEIVVKNYSKGIIKYLTNIIKGKNILITVLNDKQISNKDCKSLKKIKKQDKTRLELSYSKEYQYKHAFKQLNLNLLRFCMILVVFVCVGFASAERFIFESDKEKIENIDLTKYEEVLNKDVIEENEDVIEGKEDVIVDEVIVETPTEDVQSYVDPYYHTYNQAFSELKKINPDTVGWIKINNTNINYPVVKANDNNYYLNHSFDKSINNFGWIYADYRSNFDKLNQNTILYGHHVFNTNLLFSDLTKTLDASWYNNTSNLILSFNTEQGNMKWEIFSIYLTPVTNDYLITNFNSEDSFMSFIAKIKSRSVKDFNVEVLGSDRILTLSTCYKDSSHRVVVHAKKI